MIQICNTSGNFWSKPGAPSVCGYYAKWQPTILNGGTNYSVVHGDWPHALNWIKNNTPYDSVFFSWWDYGYWITSIGDRISLADNATLIDHQIERIGYVFFKNEDDAWLQLTKPHSAVFANGVIGLPHMEDKEQKEVGFDSDYVLIFLAGMKITGPEFEPYYILEGGGDESKKSWFMKIAGIDSNELLQSDGHTPKDAFWDTMLGKMIPFRIAGYANPATNEIHLEYQHGLVPFYTPEIKYPTNGDGPFRLVYASPSIDRSDKGPITAVLIYEINKNYKN